VIREAVNVLYERELADEEQRIVKLTDVNLEFHPMLPMTDLYISVSDQANGLNYILWYSSYVIEFRLYFIDETVFDCYTYECHPGQRAKEWESQYYHLYDFEVGILSLLSTLPVEEISITTEP
jgi:hypothetical protein